MHILLVEDHEDTRIILTRLLTRYGYDVVSAGTMHEALMLLDNIRFDVLLSDIGLPDGDGLQLVGEAKRRQGLRGTVALSALATAEDRQRGYEAGFDDYLTKPTDCNRLRTVLARLDAAA